MLEAKIHRVGDDTVMTLTPEMLPHLGAKVGDTVYVVLGDASGLR